MSDSHLGSDSPAGSLPAGWYPDGATEGKLRYWDGAAWTEHLADIVTATPVAGKPSKPPKRRRKGLWIGIGSAGAVVLLLIVIGTTRAGSGESPAAQAASTHHRSSVSAFVSVDNVAGEPALTGSQDLEADGFVVNATDATGAPITSLTDGYSIVSESPASYTKVARGSVVTLVVKPILVAVPNVVGQDPTTAQSTLAGAGFQSTTDPATVAAGGTVTAESPAAGTQTAEGSSVTMTVSPPTVQYSIWGNGTNSDVITYNNPGNTDDIEQASNAPLPWSLTSPYDPTDSFNFFSISAQDDNGSSISCAITVNGKIVDQETATGQYAIVQCGD